MRWTLGSACQAPAISGWQVTKAGATRLEDAICLAVTADDHDGDFARSFQAYQDVRIVRTAREQISSLMMDRLNHAEGVERKVRNSLFAGRKADEFYDQLAWLYTPPSYVTAALAS